MAPSSTTSTPSTPRPDAQITPSHSLTYWTSTPPTISGMLGGLPQISTIDLRGSYAFLQKLLRLFPPQPPHQPPELQYPIDPEKTVPATTRSRARDAGSSNDKMVEGAEMQKGMAFRRGLDCGAGIGRVTGGLLSRVCEVVDAVEPVGGFASKIRECEMLGVGKVAEVYICGLEAFVPSRGVKGVEEGGEKDVVGEGEEGEGIYNLIWIQWCVGHITDAQLVLFLRNCRGWLRKGGWVVVKENMSTTRDEEGNVVDIFDKLDSSVTRSDESFRRIFRESGWRVERTELQRGFVGVVKGLLPVRFYALRPATGV